jgi:hypothetical protein
VPTKGLLFVLASVSGLVVYWIIFNRVEINLLFKKHGIE